MSRAIRLALAAATLSVAFAPRALQAQAAQGAPASAASAAPAADSLAFPRQFVKWVFTSQGDSAFAHAGPSLREGMKSAAQVNEMATRIQTRFGDRQGTDVEVQFAEDSLKVYIVVMHFDQAPEPGAWVVAYSPATQVVQRASFGSLTSVKARYPQAKLP
jgi:hypothetical protein